MNNKKDEIVTMSKLEYVWGWYAKYT